MKKLTDVQKMSMMLEALNTKAFTFSNNIGYKQPSSVYHVLDGIQGISELMIKRILETYPVNPEFLRLGKEPVLLKNPIDIAKSNLRITNDFTMLDIPMLLGQLVENTGKIAQLLEDKKNQQ